MKNFDLPSPHAIAAKRGAGQVITWHAIGTNQHEMAIFADQLLFTLQPCFKIVKKMKDRKYEQFYQLWSTDEFDRETFLRKCGVEANPTLYQHITDNVLMYLPI